MGADVYTAEGPLLPYKNRRKQIKTTHPKELFLSLASNDFETASSFKMEYKALTKADLAQIERSGEGGVFSLTKDGSLSTASIIFIASVGGGIVLIVLASVLCCYVCRQRKKQQVI